MNLNLAGVLLLFVLAGCTGSKMLPLNETPELTITAPYFQRIMPGQEDGVKSLVLNLPCNEIMDSYKVDSVYFMGYHEALQTIDAGKAKGYRAKIMLPENHLFILPPYPLQKNEALVSYLDEEKNKRYFRVKDITERETIFMP